MELNLVDHSKVAFIMVNIILGSILLYSYYYYIKYGGIAVNLLWGDANKYKNVLLFTMGLAVIGYVLIAIYALVYAKQSSQLINLVSCQILIISISMLWLPITIMFLKSKHKSNKLMLTFAIIIVLFLVALTSIKQILIIEKLNYMGNNKMKHTFKKLAIVGACLFAFQTFVMDFLVWDIGFFLSKNNV